MNAPQQQMNRPSFPSYPPPASASNQPVAAAQYYVFSADNNHVGPVTADLIARGVAAGKVQNDALVAPVGSSQWVSLTSIPEIATALSAHAPNHSSMRPISQPGTMLLAPEIPPPAQVASPLEAPPPPKAEEKKEEKKPTLDPRFKLLPLAIFGCFAFLGVIETAVALLVMK